MKFMPSELAGMSRLICSAALLLICGCGGSDNVTVYPAKGVVRYEGQPMAGGGSISLIPTSPQKGKTAGGIINPDGTFVLMTYQEGDGSMAGTFRVVINQTVVEEPDFGGDSDAPGAAEKAGPVEVVGREQQIPPIYSDPNHSPATVTIEEKDQNELTVELSRM